MVDQAGVLSGVIDWGDVHLGDPAVDVSIMFLFLPPEGHDLFEEHYGPMEKRQKNLARFRALCHTAAVWCYALATDDVDLNRECRLIMGWLE